jgi:hypothetical protein
MKHTALRSLYSVPDFATGWTKSTLDMKFLFRDLRPFSQPPTDSYPGGNGPASAGWERNTYAVPMLLF